MDIHVLMGQRKCSYPGEYAPEALACISEYNNDDNPDYLKGARQDNLDTGEFEAVEIIVLQVPDDAIEKQLHPQRDPVEVTVQE